MFRYEMSRWEQSPVEIYHLLFIDKAASQADASQRDGPGFESQLGGGVVLCDVCVRQIM